MALCLDTVFMYVSVHNIHEIKLFCVVKKLGCFFRAAFDSIILKLDHVIGCVHRIHVSIYSC